jgi:hypothetical protein
LDVAFIGSPSIILFSENEKCAKKERSPGSECDSPPTAFQSLLHVKTGDSPKKSNKKAHGQQLDLRSYATRCEII